MIHIPTPHERAASGVIKEASNRSWSDVVEIDEVDVAGIAGE